MSGIVGIVNTDGASVDRDLLRRLTDSLAYRGPDAQAIWADRHVGLGHTLLATTDEAVNERQPMSLDGEVWITADARADARVELRREIANGQAADLTAATDVELILHAYHRWDTDCVDHLLGDFAFAIWDGRKRRLFCARDHFGVKPFFYVRRGNVLLFSNTLNCLRLHPAVGDTLNEIAIGDFLLFGTNQDPATTIFADIARLPPAHRLTWTQDRMAVARYWSLPTGGRNRLQRPGDYVEKFTEILRAAVDDRLRTPSVAVEMSGGLDSPSIAAIAKKVFVDHGGGFDIRAYTYVYDRLLPDRERHFSELAAQALGIPVHHFALDECPPFEPPIQGDVREPEPFYVYPHSTAGADGAMTAAAHSRVLLTGWDGDALLSESPRFYFRMLLKEGAFGELAAGWAWFLRVRHAPPPMGFRTWLKRRLGRYPVRSLYPAWVDPAFAGRVDLRSRWELANAEPQPPHPTRPLASTLLSVPNWWALFESYDPGLTGLHQEARYPLLDRRLVEYVLAIPAVPWSIDKHVLRQAMNGTLPDAVRLRAKTPLAANPATVVLSRCARHWIDDFVPSPELEEYVVRGSIPRIAGETNAERLWLDVRPYILDRWLRNAIPFGAAADGRYSQNVRPALSHGSDEGSIAS